MAVLQIPITKAKVNGVVQTIPVNTDAPEEGGDLPAVVFAEMLFLGAKQIMNRGMSKVTKAAYPTAEALAAAAMEIANKTFANMKEGKVRLTSGAKRDKASGEVMTEARRLARNFIKDELKRQKVKVSYIPAKDITAAANAFLATDEGKTIMAQAQANVEARKEVKSAALAEITGKLQADPKKVAKAQADAAAAKAVMSKTQAGITARTKPGQRPNA